MAQKRSSTPAKPKAPRAPRAKKAPTVKGGMGYRTSHERPVKRIDFEANEWLLAEIVDAEHPEEVWRFRYQGWFVPTHNKSRVLYPEGMGLLSVDEHKASLIYANDEKFEVAFAAHEGKIEVVVAPWHRHKGPTRIPIGHGLTVNQFVHGEWAEHYANFQDHPAAAVLHTLVSPVRFEVPQPHRKVTVTLTAIARPPGDLILEQESLPGIETRVSQLREVLWAVPSPATVEAQAFEVDMGRLFALNPGLPAVGFERLTRCPDATTIARLASNPNLPASLYEEFAYAAPSSFKQNPAFPLLLLEDPTLEATFPGETHRNLRQYLLRTE